MCVESAAFNRKSRPILFVCPSQMLVPRERYSIEFVKHKQETLQTLSTTFERHLLTCIHWTQNTRTHHVFPDRELSSNSFRTIHPQFSDNHLPSTIIRTVQKRVDQLLAVPCALYRRVPPSQTRFGQHCRRPLLYHVQSSCMRYTHAEIDHAILYTMNRERCTSCTQPSCNVTKTVSFFVSIGQLRRLSQSRVYFYAPFRWKIQYKSHLWQRGHTYEAGQKLAIIVIANVIQWINDSRHWSITVQS